MFSYSDFTKIKSFSGLGKVPKLTGMPFADCKCSNSYFSFARETAFINYWSNTEQKDQLGTFVDQNSYGLGLAFAPKQNTTKFWNTLEYRAGLNYDSGNLEINHKKISNYTVDFGLGIPLRYDGLSMLNLTYSYGNKGLVYESLIQEHYPLISVWPYAGLKKENLIRSKF